jgi:hypothetical protein
MEDSEHLIIWEAPVVVPPELRLYYDDTGHVICYTCEKLDGNYIVIDALTFAQGRPDIRVVDGRISTVSSNLVVSKLMPDEHEGVTCAFDDISIITNDSYTGKIQKWKLNTYELG